MRMIVTDLDGTLLRDDKTISPYTASVLHGIQQQGTKIVIATARPRRATMPYIQQIKPDAVILHNGALVYIGDELYRNFGISIDVAEKILQHAAVQFPKMLLSVEIDDTLYANFDFAPAGWEYIPSNFSNLPGRAADKILFSANDIDSLNVIASTLPKELHAIIGLDNLLMVMNKNACKYLAIKDVAAYYGITHTSITAFGDDTNDIEMLKHCSTGVAMANAATNIQQAANHVCDTNQNDGVAHWLTKNM